MCEEIEIIYTIASTYLYVMHTHTDFVLFQQWEKSELKSYLIKNETPQRNMLSIKF